jgi:hypothetical protein
MPQMFAGETGEAEGALLEATRSIGEEVLEKTGGDSYRAGQPLRNTPDSLPEPTSGETKPQPTKEGTETPTVEEPKLYAGKYKTMEEWERATTEAGNTIARLNRERDELDSRLKSIEATVAPKTETKPDPLDAIENYGLDKNVFKEAMRATIQEVMEETAKPYNARVQADQAIIEKYPEYKDRFPEVISFLRQNPDVERQVSIAESQGAYELAREYAWLKFNQTQGTEQEAAKIEQSREQAKDKAQRMVDATVTDRKSGHTRDRSTEPKDDRKVSAEELENLKGLVKGGYGTKAWAQVLSPLLPKEDSPWWGQ